MYKQAEQLPNVNYIGFKPNNFIKDHLHTYQMYAYPSIFEETFSNFPYFLLNLQLQKAQLEL